MHQRFVPQIAGLAFLASVIVPNAVVGQGDDNSLRDPIWREAFEPLSAVQPEPTLAVLLITSDDPFRTAMPGVNVDADRKGNEGQAAKQLPWCAADMTTTYHGAISVRPDLKDQISMQALPVGFPRELTGGNPSGMPPRAVIAICDARYQLLTLTVGIPDPDEFLTLIEDAEETRTLAQQFSEQPTKLLEAITERSSERVNRFYQAAIEEALALVIEDLDRDEKPNPVSVRPNQNQLIRSFEAFEPVYLADVKLRFGLNEAADLRRLLILEHHVETRGPWCESIRPIVAMMDTETLLPPLIESLWGHSPVYEAMSAEQETLVAWAESQIEDNVMVWGIKPSASLRFVPWPPVSDLSRRRVTWLDFDAAANDMPFRMVDVPTIAHLIRTFDWDPVDLSGAIVRYAITLPKQKTLKLVRESDSPERFTALLKKSHSSLVKN